MDPGLGLGRSKRSLPRVHRFSSALPTLLDSKAWPFSQMPKSGRRGSAVRRTHPRVPGLISCTLGLREDIMLIVQDAGLFWPNRRVFADLKDVAPVHGLTACFAWFSVSSRRTSLIGAFGSIS